MIYRVDYLPESNKNPITGCEYDSSWVVFKLSNSSDYKIFTGKCKEGFYFTRVSKCLNVEWWLSVGDFVGYCEANGLNGILVMSKVDYCDAMKRYSGHSYNEAILRENEPHVLIHSTTTEGWHSIQHDGYLKSWNLLKGDNLDWEPEPIGAKLGDIDEYRDYIMFGEGVSGEIVINSKLSGFINMDVHSEYHTGARLYFDSKKMAQAGLLIRDGAHIKVKNSMPLDPYLIWVATWDKIGLDGPISTPEIFSETADRSFKSEFSEKNMIKTKELYVNDITSDMLSDFHHHQLITEKWVKNHVWELVETSELREWDDEKRLWIPNYLKEQIGRGSSVVAAYDGDVLIGFGSLDGCLAGESAKYANLTMLFVDDKWKRKGIGKNLFDKLCMCARNMGADKLFISSIASAETVAFYFSMGCEDAGEIIPAYVDTEQDRYLEYSI